MASPRFVLKLLARAEGCGVREELVGDLLEEIDRGRSRLWMYHQLIAVCGLACIGCLRQRVRVTPQAVAVSLSVALLAGSSVASVSRVLEAWLTLYYATGMLSLFAHMASSAGRVGSVDSAAGRGD